MKLLEKKRKKEKTRSMFVFVGIKHEPFHTGLKERIQSKPKMGKKDGNLCCVCSQNLGTDHRPLPKDYPKFHHLATEHRYDNQRWCSKCRMRDRIENKVSIFFIPQTFFPTFFFVFLFKRGFILCF
jgi:hypothetical protein